jgi:hypothetical protein
VDNFVDKQPLTVGNTRFHAVFYKLLIWKAKLSAFKIKDLEKSFVAA